MFECFREKERSSYFFKSFHKPSNFKPSNCFFGFFPREGRGDLLHSFVKFSPVPDAQYDNIIFFYIKDDPVIPDMESV